MKFVILRGRWSQRFFGVQLVVGIYTVQCAFLRFGVYNSRSCAWWPVARARGGSSKDAS